MTAHSWALAIQGPMVSPLPAKSWLRQMLEEQEKDGRAARATEEDCSGAIEQTVRLAGSAVRHVLLSTWSDEVSAGIARRVAARVGCDLVLCDDPGQGSGTWGRLPDNRWRQVRSTTLALERLISGTGATHVVRTRSDQVIDVAAIIAAVEQQEGDPRPRSVGQCDYIYVPGVLETVPYAIDDFYFAGRLADVWRFFAAQWELRRCYRGIDSVHADLVLKHAARNLRGVLPRALFPFELYPVVNARRDLDTPGRPRTIGERYLRLWSDILELSIKPLPRAVYESIVFRGVPYKLRYGRMFLEEWLEYRHNINQFFRSRYPEAFSGSAFGALGLLLNYAPECAFLGRDDALGASARTAHSLRRALSGRYRGGKPQQLT